MVEYGLFHMVCSQETHLKFNIGECKPKEALQICLACVYNMHMYSFCPVAPHREAGNEKLQPMEEGGEPLSWKVGDTKRSELYDR